MISDHFYIVNTADDSLAAVADTGVPTGSTPVRVAVSHDAKTAWVLSNTTDRQYRHGCESDEFRNAGLVKPGSNGASSMVLSARSLLYVYHRPTACYEIDPVSLSRDHQWPDTGSVGQCRAAAIHSRREHRLLSESNLQLFHLPAYF